MNTTTSSLVRCGGIAAISFLAAGAGAGAAPIPGLRNTGVATNGALAANGAVDPHYRLIQSSDPAAPGPNALVASSLPGAWLANGPNSKWIAPSLNQNVGNQPGDYTYRITFSLDGLDPASAVITGRWSSDNAGSAVLLNGVATGITYDGNFGRLSDLFTINSGFIEGTNTLDFVVNNAPPGVNPTAFRAEVSGTADPVLPAGTPPSITVQPASQSVGFGDGVTFSVGVVGSRPLRYQWRRDGNLIPNATNAVLTIPSAMGSDAGAYDVVITNDAGMVTSATATLTLRLLSPAELTYEPLGPSSRRTGLTFSEIMYHPTNRADGRNLEFVEIYNSNPFREELSGYRLTGQIDYTFPSNTFIAGRGFLVIAPSPGDVEAAYGISGVLGGGTNRFDNNGGTLRLRKKSGAVVLEVNYSDGPPWPAAADGTGHSLVLAKPTYGEGNPQAWAHSALVGGSPGAPDPVPTGLLESVVINEVAAHLDDGESDFIELFNTAPVTVDISGCWLSDRAATNRYRIPSGTILAPSGFAVFTLRAAGESVYFWNPSQTRVIDAVAWENQGEDFSWGRFPDGTPQFFPGERTFGSNNVINRGVQFELRQHDIFKYPVVINEIMYRPLSGDKDDEFVELHNASTNTIDLGGWRLTGGIGYTFPSNAMIAANGFVVVAADKARFLTNYPNVSPGIVFGNFSGQLANGGERIALRRPELLRSPTDVTTVLYPVVDEVTYQTGGRWPNWANGGGSSLELIDPRSPWRLGPNWAASDESGRAPWTLVEATGALTMPHGGVPSADQLQVFLQGAGEALVDDVEVLVAGQNRVRNPSFETGVTNWVFQGTHRRSYWETNEGFNSARSLHLVATERGDHVANRARTTLSATIAANTVVTIRARVRWLKGHPEILLRLRNNSLEAVGRLNVPKYLGTPGAPNTAARANGGPAITDVSHRPVLPAPNVAIRVTARVLDPDGVSSVALKYRLDPATMGSTVAMRDDGAGGDQRAGDGVFTGVLPGQPSGTLIAFHLEATDAFASPARTLFPDDAPRRECLIRVGEAASTNAFGTYRLWMTKANHDFWAAREKMSNEDVDATFVYGTTRVVYNAGGHYSGSSYTAPIYTSPTGALCGYDINFGDDDAVLGATHFTLDWPIRDETDQREQLMFWFLEQFGLPNMYRRYVNVFVNGLKRGTIYDDVQQPSGDAIAAFFPDDTEGSLYKTDCWNEFTDATDRIDPCILNSLENFTVGGVKKVARYRWNWRPRSTEGTANDFSDLFALVDAANAPSNTYQSQVEGLVDIEHWMRTFCMTDLASFWDAFGNPNAKNTYLYKPQHSGWKQFCWDFDVGLGVFNDPTNDVLFPSLGDPVMDRLMRYPAFLRLYWNAMDEAVNSFFTTNATIPILAAKFDAFRANGINLTSPFVPSGQYGLSIPTWIAQRRRFLISQMNAVSGAFAVTSSNNISTNRNLLLLTGNAPARVYRITVNGVAYPITWRNTTQWTMTVPLLPGDNTLNIVALDRNGTVLTNASQTVTYTGESVSPVGVVVINEIMYNPVSSEASYVELFNTSTNQAFDLSGWELNGADYTFPPGSLIAPGQFLVLAKNRAAFTTAYGNRIAVFGEFGGQLDDGGETLSLLQPGATLATAPTVVDRVTYDDDPPWPASADGRGAALQLIDAAQDNSRVSNWGDGSGWRYFSFTTNNTSPDATRLSFFFETNGGDVFLDDIVLSPGTVANAADNVLAPGDFESGLGSWIVAGLATNTSVSTTMAFSGQSSLRLVFSPGAQALTNFYIDFPALTPNTNYTLAFWYFGGERGTNLNARITGTFRTTLNPQPARFTPGAANGGGTLPLYPPLWLSEVQPNNVSGLTDNAGDTEPWIELHNAGNSALSLDGVSLADDYADLTCWSFPAGTAIQPGQYLLVWADGEPAESVAGALHTKFRLNPTNGTVVLSRRTADGPQILDYFNYRDVGTNRSYGSYPPGQASYRQVFYFPTPRGTNDPHAPLVPLFLNEWLASNTRVLADPADQDFDDWFEIYNPTTNRVELAGYRLTDNLNSPNKFVVPPGITIPPQGYLLVWADEESGQTRTNGDLHVNFRLGQAGETLTLFAPDGRVVDSITFGPQTNNISQGRLPDGATPPYVFFPVPTPRRPNSLAASTIRLQIAIERDVVKLCWQSELRRGYRVECKADLNEPTWTPCGATLGLENPTVFRLPYDGRQQFYRVQVVP